MKLIRELGLKPLPKTRVKQRKFMKNTLWGLFRCQGCGELVEKILIEGKKLKYCSRKCSAKHTAQKISKARSKYKERYVALAQNGGGKKGNDAAAMVVTILKT